MTTWLTDSPEAAAPFVHSNTAWKPCSTGESGGIGVLAAAFNPDQTTWLAHSTDDARPDDRVIVLIDTAPRSQFDAMLDLVRSPMPWPDPVICLALTGSRFRGQRSRSWSALRGNLHVTARYRLNCPAAASQAAITMLPAIAAAETISAISAGRIEPKIKWVNDVLVAGKKVSGVLSATQITGSVMDSAVFGIGLNIAQTPDMPPTPFAPPAGCLAEHDVSLHDALPQLFHRLVRNLDASVELLKQHHSDSLFMRYRAMAGFIGERVLIWPEGTDTTQAEPLHRSRVLGLNPDLSLVLEGVAEPVRSGRLAYAHSPHHEPSP